MAHEQSPTPPDQVPEEARQYLAIIEAHNDHPFVKQYFYQVTLETVFALASQLSLIDQRKLVQQIAGRLAEMPPGDKPPVRHWSEIRGMLPFSASGEDTQAWVSRSRQESR